MPWEYNLVVHKKVRADLIGCLKKLGTPESPMRKAAASKFSGDKLDMEELFIVVEALVYDSEDDYILKLGMLDKKKKLNEKTRDKIIELAVLINEKSKRYDKRGSPPLCEMLEAFVQEVNPNFKFSNTCL